MFYESTVLENGLTVITEKMDTVRSVALGIWFAVGSRDESPAEAGMSHFMEHMMFKGTPSMTAAEISELFDGLGAELNAFTSKEYTCYYARVVDEHVPTAMTTLSDMVVNSLLADEACESERQVVIEEIARMEDTPDDRVHEMFGRALWPTHPIGLPILGNRETVGGFDNAQATTFRARHYLTGNCVVAAAGNVEHEAVVALVRESLALPHGPRSERPEALAVSATSVEMLEKETEQTHIIYGTAAMNAHHKDRFALSVMDSVFGGGMSSRLFQEIREKRGLVYSVYSFPALYQDTGSYAVYAGTRPENAEQVLGLIRQEMDKLHRGNITAKELTRSKESLKGQLMLGSESTRSRMTRLGKNAVINGEILSLTELVERIDAITLEDVARVADMVFSEERVLALIGPHTQQDVNRFAE
ncbi:MAG: M16 family metallopeptidase [Coriobacteriia bacterium]